MRRFLPVWLLLGPAIFVAAAFTPSSPAPDYKGEIYPLLKKYCGSCHGEKDGAAGISLLSFHDQASLESNRAVWDRVVTNLSDKHMPPAGNPSPSQMERDLLVNFVRGVFAPKSGPPNPGRVTMRRLNREEYNNTIRDLFGVDLRPAENFPSDDVGYGFDNIGDVLSMSPLLMEKYLNAAQRVAETVIYAPGSKTVRISGADMDSPNSELLPDGTRMLFSNADMTAEFRVPVEGDYKLSISAYQEKAGLENAKMAMRVGGETVKLVDVDGEKRNPQTFDVTFHATAGKKLLGGSFVNDYYRPKTATQAQEDRNLVIQYAQLDGPLNNAVIPSETQNRIIFVHPTASTRLESERKILSVFARRAYRRPVTTAEVEKLVTIAELAHKNGESFERGIQLGITAALCSPNFLFRVEKPVGEMLGQYEMASRLSYFLWSSMPDEELLSLAAKGQLQKPEVLAVQAKRMLRDPKAGALADNFAGQWLQLRKLAIVAPDKKLFPIYTPDLKRAIATETRMFFQDIVSNDRSVLDFIDGRYSFLNQALAKLYDIPNVFGSEFRRVQLPEDRGGILTQASVLTVTSNPTRTSPVKRGKWILENILGTPPPPPPPGVGVLKDDHSDLDTVSLREKLEQHRKDPACAVCHATMDGMGFALENFNAVGQFRTTDGRFGIDASGTLPDGAKFVGSAELRATLMKKKGLFVRCLAQKMLTFATGRGMESYDDRTIDGVARAVSGGEYKFSALVTAVVQSDAFRKSRAEK